MAVRNTQALFTYSRIQDNAWSGKADKKKYL